MLKTLCKETHSKYVYIRRLMQQGYLNEYKDELGRLSYSVEELEQTKSIRKVGRPSKHYDKRRY